MAAVIYRHSAQLSAPLSFPRLSSSGPDQTHAREEVFSEHSNLPPFSLSLSYPSPDLGLCVSVQKCSSHLISLRVSSSAAAFITSPHSINTRPPKFGPRCMIQTQESSAPPQPPSPHTDTIQMSYLCHSSGISLIYARRLGILLFG